MHFSPSFKFMVLFILLMFSDFYPFGRSVVGRENFKNHLKFNFYGRHYLGLYLEKINKIMLLFQF